MKNWGEELEQEVMKMLLSGDDPVLLKLDEQYKLSQIERRKMTGVGFFIDFLLPGGTSLLENKQSFQLSDVKAEIEGLENGAGFVLFVQDGKLSMLEGYSYDEPWPSPDQTVHFTVSYINGKQRDFDALRKELKGSTH